MSLAQITGPALLGNVRKLDGKAVIIDAEFYVSSGETLMSALRFFNHDNHSFGEVGSYIVHATVSCPPE
jgi:hypothetical protein